MKLREVRGSMSHLLKCDIGDDDACVCVCSVLGTICHMDQHVAACEASSECTLYVMMMHSSRPRFVMCDVCLEIFRLPPLHYMYITCISSHLSSIFI